MQTNVKDDGTAGGGAPARGREGGPLTELELGAWRGMLQAHAALVRRLDADLRARHGLTLSGYEVLMLIGTSERGRLRISELSGGTLLSVSGISRMVDRLARDGLVVRESCEDDGRGQEVALTPSGRGRLRAARASHLHGVRREFLELFTDAELGEMAGWWRRVEAEPPPARAGARRGRGAPDGTPPRPRP